MASSAHNKQPSELEDAASLENKEEKYDHL
jgi:hypothetical protein